MKKITLILITLLNLTTMIHAQQNKASIEIIGNSTYQKDIQKYRAVIVLSLDYKYNDELLTIEEIKTNYFKSLEKKGINTSQLKEDMFSYLTIGQQKEGTYFIFETSSKDTFFKLLSVKQDGVQILLKTQIFVASPKEKELAEKAIENARHKAKAIATGLGKKIGKIIAISISNSIQGEHEEYIDSFSINEKETFSVIVKFELIGK